MQKGTFKKKVCNKTNIFDCLWEQIRNFSFGDRDYNEKFTYKNTHKQLEQYPCTIDS